MLCECAFSTFPDKWEAAAELFGALGPGGRLRFSDVWVRGGLPAPWRDLLGWVACVAAAESPEGYRALVAGAAGLGWAPGLVAEILRLIAAGRVGYLTLTAVRRA